MNQSVLIFSFFWRLLERFGTQVVTLIITIVLARILGPSIYGNIALIMVIISILQVFIDSGLGCALIQKTDSDDVDFSSVFVFNILMCFVLYVVIYISAQHIALFYNNYELTSVIRILSIVIIVYGLKNIQQAYIAKYYLFKLLFYASLSGTILSGIVGIWMAVNGWGLWALVAQILCNNIVSAIVLWFTVKWRPRMIFSLTSLYKLLSYGWKLLLSSIIDVTFNKLNELMIGKIYNSSDLAFFTKGGQYPSVLAINITASLESVLFPYISSKKNDIILVKSIARRALKLSVYIIMPLLFGVAACAEPIIRVLLTNKWIPCVPYLRVFCIIYSLYPIHVVNLNIINAIGRSDVFLKLEIFKKTISIIFLFIAIKYGPLAIAYSILVSSVISMLINIWPNKRFIHYGLIEQFKDIYSSIILSIIMSCVMYYISNLLTNDIYIIFIQIISGLVIYLSVSIIFKLDNINYIINMLKTINK